jgi:chromosome segregation ATPase
MTAAVMSKEQAAAAAQAAVRERDAIQANLLELDASFGKRLLAGAALTGQTRQRWDAAAAALAGLFGVYSAYSAGGDRVAGVAGGRLGARELAALSALLIGPSVQLNPGPGPLAGRDLADTGREELTLADAVARMRRAFATVTEVVSAAERVWNEMTGRLDSAGAELDRLTSLAATLADEALTGNLTAAQGKLARLRGTLNCDPLALWQGNGVDTSGADRLAERVSAAATRVDELVRLRDDARNRIAQVTAAAARARAARDDAGAAWQRAATKIAAEAMPEPPDDIAGVSGRLAALDALLAAGRWTRLESELDLLERELEAAAARFIDTERAVVALMSRRDELRGLLDAYKAKAARLGAAEDAVLAERYSRARDLLWTAPCDLAAAADAVTGYQQAVLAAGGQAR